MQSFQYIDPATALKNSITPLNDNLRSLRSCQSGTVFPTVELYDGMLCYRTDEAKLYELTDKTGPTWKVVRDFNKTLLYQEDADSRYAFAGHDHDSAYAALGHGHSNATTNAAGFMSASDKVKLNGVSGGAEVNQNTFGTVVAGGVSLVADQKQDTLTFVAGSNVTLSPDKANDQITIGIDLSGTNGEGSRTVSTSGPSGGSNGDMWLEV